MKKLLLFIMPLMFLIACSGGGGGGDLNSTPQNNHTGVFELVELELDGIDLMPAYSEALYYFHPDGSYEIKGYLAEDGSYVNGVGEYSISNNTMYSKSTILTGNNQGLYQASSSAINWLNENEVEIFSSSSSCVQGEGYARYIKTTNSLGNAPSNSVIGVWEVTEANLGGQDILTPNYSQVLYYYFPDGSFGTELYFLDGSFDWAYGNYWISGDQTLLTTSSTLNSTGHYATGSLDITKFETDKVELYTPNFLETGDAYTLKVRKLECVSLANWKK